MQISNLVRNMVAMCAALVAIIVPAAKTTAQTQPLQA
jgi:hypothetical protein